jgi:hypothetical protein
MDSLQLWARDGEAVRQAIALGEIAHRETASAELTDAFLLCAIESGLWQTWAQTFPDPRREPEIGMEVILPAPLAAPGLPGCIPCVKRAMCCARRGCWAPWGRAWR